MRTHEPSKYSGIGSLNDTCTCMNVQSDKISFNLHLKVCSFTFSTISSDLKPYLQAYGQSKSSSVMLNTCSVKYVAFISVSLYFLGFDETPLKLNRPLSGPPIHCRLRRLERSDIKQSNLMFFPISTTLVSIFKDTEIIPFK